MSESGAEWRPHVAAWQEAGGTLSGYCRRHGLKESTMRYWAKRLKRESAAAVNAAVAPKMARVRRRRRRSVEARTASQAEPSAAQPVLRVVVGLATVEVPEGFDADTFEAVFDVLRVHAGGPR